MKKRTLSFSNPAYLSLKDNQLVIRLPEVENNDTLPDSFKQNAVRTIPVEDIGVVLLDNKRITITQGLLEALLENNCAVITCDNRSMPCGLMLPLEGHTIQQERFTQQIEVSLPLRKQLWQQTVVRKIENQAAVLRKYVGCETGNMDKWAAAVRSGDADNMEARAAAYYWANIFPDIPDFTRRRDGAYPNNWLNYGYAILRATVARALVSAGLLPTLGIHHHNRYNAYCLADDIMEPYRPFVDERIKQMMKDMPDEKEISKEVKAALLTIPVMDVMIDGNSGVLMVAVSKTVASLQKCYSGELRNLIYPMMK
ncbi:MAG: type II CRISPR-associated endonuclease Cas1 [Bacteroidales bacterium]|nr:type II CRISPR-associated endonuclease Cas1 [Bacteroidales bacterium]